LIGALFFIRHVRNISARYVTSWVLFLSPRQTLSENYLVKREALFLALIKWIMIGLTRITIEKTIKTIEIGREKKMRKLPFECNND